MKPINKCVLFNLNCYHCSSSLSRNCLLIYFIFGNFPARSIPTALSAGAALAVTSALLDAGGQTTRIDNGKEYAAYTTEKRPSPLP